MIDASNVQKNKKNSFGLSRLTLLTTDKKNNGISIMFYSFIYAAFPWVVLGLSIAVAATYISEKYQDKGE